MWTYLSLIKEEGERMKKYVTTTYRIQISGKKLPAGKTRVVFLSDLHNCAGTGETEELLRRIEEASPDLVLCGGDMIMGKKNVSPEPAVRFMRALSERYTVYTGEGNHEYRAGLYREQYGDLLERYEKGLAGCDVVFLKNDSATGEIRGIPFAVYGYELPAYYYDRLHHRDLDVGKIREVLGRPDEDKLTFLLAHNPSYTEEYLAWGADLTLSGHYHGGVMRFGAHHGAVTPDLRIFNRHSYGLFRNGRKSAIVTSGCGEHTIPVRIRNPREIVVIDMEIV